MRLNPPILTAGLLLSLTSLNAEAALAAYIAAGDTPVVYSSVSNITWTGDANLLGSLIRSQGYNNMVNAIIAASPVINDNPNGLDTPPYSGSHNVSRADFDDAVFSDSQLGRTSWFGAQAFTTYLNSINYAGSNQWALPSVGANHQDISLTSGQFGQLYYNELNALAYPGHGSDYGILHDGSLRTSGNAGSFTNAQTYAYWLGTEHAYFSSSAWGFYTYAGYPVYFDKDVQFYSWAVSPGQVGAVPEPGVVWMMGIAFIGLLGLKRCRHD